MAREPKQRVDEGAKAPTYVRAVAALQAGWVGQPIPLMAIEKTNQKGVHLWQRINLSQGSIRLTGTVVD